MSDADADAAYERYYVPAPGRVIFQAAFANLNPRAGTKVDFHKDDRPPLLVVGNDQDHTVPASVSREAAKRLGKPKAVVDYKEFAGRPHFTAGRARLGSGGRPRARMGEPPHGRADYLQDRGTGDGLTCAVSDGPGRSTGARCVSSQRCGCHPAARVKRSAQTRSPSRQTL
jgi:hypothetical protein